MDDGDRFDEYRADQMVREHDAREESALLDQRAEELARIERDAFVEKLTELDESEQAEEAEDISAEDAEPGHVACPECGHSPMREDDHVFICSACDYETGDPR